VGVASAVAGSWVASKIHVYHENRRLHQEDLKQRILIPIRSGLDDSYSSLVSHTSAVVSTVWGKRSVLQDAKVTEYPEVQGTILHVADPRAEIEANLDEALLVDARETHFRQLIAAWERFRDSWTKHSQNCEAWISKMAGQILEQSGLAALPRPYGEPYVMHLDLALFVYRRMFQIPTEALSRGKLNEGWCLKGGGGTTLARGSEERIEELLVRLENLLKSERRPAQELRQEAERLGTDLKSLHQKLSLAIAEKRLRRGCAMVPFL
jgi:hypothetical protein